MVRLVRAMSDEGWVRGRMDVTSGVIEQELLGLLRWRRKTTCCNALTVCCGAADTLLVTELYRFDWRGACTEMALASPRIYNLLLFYPRYKQL